ncbi:lipase family protein [Motiliproteus sp. MSK22-1]|uniref:lipase family protein n=1 Tax=Motiliproteus sp. MSK22-1 TaxID=1897630 RepID=UPI000975DDEB|nr:Mbeg1-like protein [Motiliproteus sp. MSK22-1]OMH39665.1 hypothetical protein BGP75_02175 [Motiliproteus sp. MSK22-1]
MPIIENLPQGLTLEQYNRALDSAKLSSQTYDWDDYLVAEAGLNLFQGIDDIKNQDFSTDNYQEVAQGGGYIDWIGTDGLDYKIFEDSDSGDLVLSFKGTEPLSLVDWVEDIEQALGQSEQYEYAVDVAQSVQENVDNYNNQQGLTGEDAIQLSFTGHSLGGGLATAAALATGNEAIVFDAAGLSQATIDSLNLDINNAANITNFNVQGDALSDYNGLMDDTTFGSFLIEQKQYGETYWLEGVNDRADFAGWLVPDDNIIVEQAEAVLNHAWHVFTYQLENVDFV